MNVPPPPPPVVGSPSKIPTWAWIVAGGALLLICAGFFTAMAQSLKEVNSIVNDLGGGPDSGGRDGEGGSEYYAANYAVICIDDFVDDLGRWPTKEEGLDALLKAPSGVANWNGPYAYDFFEDEYGNKVIYDPLPDGYRVTSLGADGKPGGSGYDADLIVERRSK